MKVLLDLRAGDGVVIPSYFFGSALMAELVRSRVFERGFPPENGDALVLDIAGEAVDFEVFPTSAGFLCYEIREANPRTLRLSEDDLRLNTLRRETFYSIMAKDLEVSGQIMELGRGIWELGRKSLPGRDRSKVFFIERGVREADLIVCLMRDGYNAHCLLFHGDLPRSLEIPGKTTALALIEVRDGRFASEVFEDLAASQKPTATETGIYLEQSPPKLWICGDEFTLPTSSEDVPTDGCKYLAYLLDHPLKEISCWDLYGQAHPLLQGEIGHAVWTDDLLDQKAKQEFLRELRDARAELHEVEDDESVPEDERAAMREKVASLLEQQGKVLGIKGRSRQITSGDHTNARQNVRKALKVVIDHVQKQNDAVGIALMAALGKGDPVKFIPPPEWEI